VSSCPSAALVDSVFFACFSLELVCPFLFVFFGCRACGIRFYPAAVDVLRLFAIFVFTTIHPVVVFDYRFFAFPLGLFPSIHYTVSGFVRYFRPITSSLACRRCADFFFFWVGGGGIWGWGATVPRSPSRFRCSWNERSFFFFAVLCAIFTVSTDISA